MARKRKKKGNAGRIIGKIIIGYIIWPYGLYLIIRAVQRSRQKKGSGQRALGSPAVNRGGQQTQRPAGASEPIVYITIEGERTPVTRSGANMMIADRERIARDCMKLIGDTATPRVFFERWELLEDTLERIDELAQAGDTFALNRPEIRRRMKENYEVYINQMIDRTAAAVEKKMAALKTIKGRLGRVEAFEGVFLEYRDWMTDGNLQRIDERRRLLTDAAKNIAE